MHSGIESKFSRPRGGVILRLRVLAAAALLFMFTGSALASVVPLRVEEMMAISDDVVTVRCAKTETGFFEGKIITKADFVVLETLKGDMAGKQSLTYMGGTFKGVAMKAAGQPTFEKGEEAILFLSRPYDRLPKEMRAGYNASSPLVMSPQVVGGWQGKLSIVSTPDTNYQRSGADAVPVKALVSRKTPRGAEPGFAKAPTYGEVLNSLREVATRHTRAVRNQVAAKEITGVYGKFVVPATSDDPVVRAFDPLPKMAYMTEEELRQYEKETKAKLRAQKDAAVQDDDAKREE